MSRSTISMYQLFQIIPNEESARAYLEGRLWRDGVTCPECKEQERITVRKGGYYRCNKCQLDFTVRTGTIFERSHIPLHKWVYAMYALVTARKGVSSLQLAKEIGVTQKSAWFMLQRLREGAPRTAKTNCAALWRLMSALSAARKRTSTNRRNSRLAVVRSARLPSSECANAADGLSPARLSNVPCRKPRSAYTRTWRSGHNSIQMTT